MANILTTASYLTNNFGWKIKFITRQGFLLETYKNSIFITYFWSSLPASLYPICFQPEASRTRGRMTGQSNFDSLSPDPA